MAIQQQYILTIDALDGSGSAKTLRFTDGDYIDGSANFYEPRLLQPAAIVVAPNDGDLLSIFKQASIGDIELANLDGGLDYLADYAVDGRAMTLSFVEGATVTSVLTGTVARMTEGKGIISFTFKALTETLTGKHPQSIYAGTNASNVGLEGTVDDIEGDMKPKVFGKCYNATPVLVNDYLSIYEASSRSDAVIIGVYDDGIRLTNYLVNGARSTGSTSIAVDSGTGGIPAGAHVIFPNSGNHTIYTVSTGFTGTAGTMVLSTGLANNLADNTAVEVVNSFTGPGTAAGELQNAITSAGWSSYNGYFRLASAPNKLVTCDVITHTSYVPHKAGDVFSAIATEIGFAVDSASVTYLNATAYLGLYLDKETPSMELFNQIARSVGGYYYFIDSTLYIDRLKAPASSVMTIEAWQVAGIERQSTGCGGNGIPIYGISMTYDRQETTQETVAGGVGKTRAAFLKKGYRQTEVIDTAVLTRHPLAEKLTISSNLKTKAEATAVATQLLGVIKVRRDVVDVVANFSQIPTFTIGNTVILKHETLGYSSGRAMVIVGNELDIKKKQITLRLVG